MSLDLESQLALGEDMPAVEAFLAEHGGELHGPADPDTDDGVRWLDLGPRGAPTDRYVACIAWTAYPHDPPSVVFVDGVDGPRGVLRAWPVIPGYRPPGDICMPFTSEGFNTHPEWRTGPTAWSSAGNPFLRVATQLQDDLDNRYQGRAG